jgi:hypothetical protein
LLIHKEKSLRLKISRARCRSLMLGYHPNSPATSDVSKSTTSSRKRRKVPRRTTRHPNLRGLRILGQRVLRNVIRAQFQDRVEVKLKLRIGVLPKIRKIKRPMNCRREETLRTLESITWHSNLVRLQAAMRVSTRTTTKTRPT